MNNLRESFLYKLCQLVGGDRSQLHNFGSTVKGFIFIYEHLFKQMHAASKMLVLPRNCQGSARFQIVDDKANASLIKRFQNGLQEPDDTLNPDYIGKPLNPEPLNL